MHHFIFAILEFFPLFPFFALCCGVGVLCSLYFTGGQTPLLHRWAGEYGVHHNSLCLTGEHKTIAKPLKSEPRKSEILANLNMIFNNMKSIFHITFTVTDVSMLSCCRCRHFGGWVVGTMSSHFHMCLLICSCLV